MADRQQLQELMKLDAADIGTSEENVKQKLLPVCGSSFTPNLPDQCPLTGDVFRQREYPDDFFAFSV
jgi:hypothetical protein